MATTARLDLSVWRNDDVYEFILRVRGLDLTNTPLAMQIRQYRDTPGAALVNLAKVTNGNAEGLRVAGVVTEAGVSVSEVRVRLNKSTRQALPYTGELGDNTPLEYALLIDGKTRLAGQIVMLAHAYGSDAAPVARQPGWSPTTAGAAPRGSATMTIADDDVVNLIIDGADLVGAQVGEAREARDAAETASAASATSAATAEAVAGPTYGTVAAGLAATTEGGSFGVGNGDGTVSIYREVGGAAVLQRKLATSDALASNAPGAGRDLIGRSSVAALIGSNAPSRGVGAFWYAGDFVYREAASGAIDHHVTTAGGVKLYVVPATEGFDVQAFGAVGDDAAVDTTRLQIASFAGSSVAVPSRSYKAGPVNLRTGQRWAGDNARIGVPAAGNTVFLVPDNAHDWRISGFQLYGTLGQGEIVADVSAESECGTQVRDAQRGIISGVGFNNFRGVGLLRNTVAFVQDRALGRGCRTLGSDLGFYNCSIGLKTEPQAGNEFDIFSNVHAGACGIGVDLNAGNTVLVGFQLVDNDINLRLRGGNNNHAHGILSAGSINHVRNGGTYLGHFSDITNGMTLNAVHAYANAAGGVGPVFYERTGGINWLGGILDAWTYVKQIDYPADRFPYNRQEKLFMPGGYGPCRILGRNAGDTGWDDYHQHMIRRDCYGPGVIDQTGVTSNDPADVYVLSEANGAGVPFASGSFLKFPTVSRIGDRRKCYSSATGLVTIPQWMTGLYEIGGHFILSGTLDAIATSYLDLVVQYAAGGTRNLSPPLLPRPYGTSNTLWTVDIGVVSKHFSAGDRIGIRATNIGGSAPALGNASWDSQWWVKKIA